MNKKGLTTIQTFLFIFFGFIGIVFLGLAVFGFNLVNTYLGQDVDIGQVNLQNATSLTFGKISNAFIDNADYYGIILLLGMAVLMIGQGYVVGKRWPKAWIVVDIFILVFAVVGAVYISQTFNTLINSTSYFSVFADNLPKSSGFVLNLPYIVAILGVLIMIFTYAGINNTEGEPQTTVLGYG